jgi:hypothetical protein
MRAKSGAMPSDDGFGRNGEECSFLRVRFET